MANLIRSAKPGSDWGRNELLSYHITVTPISPQEFFRQGADPSLTGLDPALINSPLDDTNVSDDTYRFLTYLDLATNAGQGTAIDDFARELLRIVGFEERGCVLRTRLIMPLSICGDIKKVAQTDVCLLDRRSTILLVLQEDKTIFYPSDPEPQVIAEAIAAYQHNNQRRERMGLSTLNTMTVPCITMTGTRPTFYLVPVTQELSDAVITGQWPKVETKVLKCVTVSGHNRGLSEGMETPEYRRVAFQRMIAFKALAKSQWEKFFVD
jgi:hypothetical protein